jgi:hypothetical protein
MRALNAKTALQNLPSRLDLAGRPFVGDMAVIDGVGSLGQVSASSEILLHQDDGLPCVGQIAAGFDEIVHDHRRESLERLVEQDDLGIADKRAPIASICCSPPERSVSRLPRRSCRRRGLWRQGLRQRREEGRRGGGGVLWAVKEKAKPGGTVPQS